MNTFTRRTGIAMVVLGSLCGCKAMGDFAVNSPTTIVRLVSSIFRHHPEPEPGPAAGAAGATGTALAQQGQSTGSGKAAVASGVPAAAVDKSQVVRKLPTSVPKGSQMARNGPALDAYKTEVAQHIVEANREQTFSGKLPPMLPAIVVLSITVDRDGNLTDVAVQRYRDADAAWVAVTSMRLSDPLPKPATLLAKNSNSLTFSETFLFDADYRFQLRSLAGPQ
jgi:protein TonB